MSKQHNFEATVRWTGNTGKGTANYRAYTRDWTLESVGKPAIAMSNDPLLGGNPAFYNPEDMLIAALSSCHMLWFLHLASDAGLTVHSYTDTPIGTGESLPDGTGRFISALLQPNIGLIPGSDTQLADAVHGKIHNHCFIARSVNFPVKIKARYFEVTHPD
ncbi:OsmC family protein [Planktotalea sp.]|uniref:OsmC family protein n=1 Tax=Planktotalea sp. TaxID=2029877 RepID=UPI0025E39405|nr:OsmC family protein [Planktotalea sp.]